MTENAKNSAATNPNITNDSKNIAANGGEEGSFRNPQEGSDWLGGPQNGSEIPGNGGNGGNGGNASGSGSGGNGDETSVGSEYWQ